MVIGCHARHQPARQEQLGVRFVAHLHTHVGIEPATLCAVHMCVHVCVCACVCVHFIYLLINVFAIVIAFSGNEMRSLHLTHPQYLGAMHYFEQLLCARLRVCVCACVSVCIRVMYSALCEKESERRRGKSFSHPTETIPTP